MNKQEMRAAVAIAALFLVRMLGLFMILPVLPLVGEELEHSTPFRVGLALGIYGLSQALLQIPFGLASDYFSRKSVITFGLIPQRIGSFLYCANEEEAILGSSCAMIPECHGNRNSFTNTAG